ncbi:Symbiotic regulator homolog 1 [Serratia plymuthica]|nr:Symbiotic regulator homolog 1 [Serratia plymuthica]
MHKTNFSHVDLNLLKLFNALVKERSVTRAGLLLGLSQPAASRALGRLRRLLNDRIVVRSSTGLELTPRASVLAEPVARLLEDARSIVAPAEFDPAIATGCFTIATVDHLALLVMPTLISKLAQQAPGLTLEIPPPLGSNVTLIAQGGADLAIGAYDNLPARFHQRLLYDEDMVCLVRRDHPVITTGLTLDKFAALSHILVIITGQGKSLIDVALAQYGLTRRVAMRLPFFLVAPRLVAESDMILSLPRRLAMQFIKSEMIEVLELPLTMDSFPMTMIWHERHHENPAHIWLRQQVLDSVRDINVESKL